MSRLPTTLSAMCVVLTGTLAVAQKQRPIDRVMVVPPPGLTHTASLTIRFLDKNEDPLGDPVAFEPPGYRFARLLPGVRFVEITATGDSEEARASRRVIDFSGSSYFDRLSGRIIEIRDPGAPNGFGLSKALVAGPGTPFASLLFAEPHFVMQRSVFCPELNPNATPLTDEQLIELHGVAYGAGLELMARKALREASYAYRAWMIRETWAGDPPAVERPSEALKDFAASARFNRNSGLLPPALARELQAFAIIKHSKSLIPITAENEPKLHEALLAEREAAAELGRELVNLFVRCGLCNPKSADGCIKAAQQFDGSEN